MSLKLLIAEDAPDIASAIAFGARMAWPGCSVSISATGEDALDCFDRERPDLVVLDVQMPPPDGFEVCQRIRESSQVPILMLTVRDGTADKVRALELGADDYLTKPFDPVELLARLRALLRRAGWPPSPRDPRFVIADLSVDTDTRDVRLSGKRVDLTATEYRLLEELVRNAGTPVPHRVLLERVWGLTYVNDTDYLKVFVRRLRQKLRDTAHRPRYIQTEWGIGYRCIGPG